MSPYSSIVTGCYSLTLLMGLLGNGWVISSVVRSRRPRNGSLTPSDRLRTYIGLLAVVDLLVTLSLVIRIVYVVLPDATIDTTSCRVIFMIDHLVKLGSITCLACISIERYITIRKPFNSKVRRRLIQFTPFVALFVLAVVLSGIATLASNVKASSGSQMNCSQEPLNTSPLIQAARWVVALSFLLQLATVSTNYGQIVRHVRRKFWQRKARAVANNQHNSRSSNTSAKQPLVAEPRYMRDMTAAIVRIACFHVLCWLPYCLLQVLPLSVRLAHSSTPLSVYVSTSVRMMSEGSVGDCLAWLGFAADWLTYVNSAGDWIFYAAMNRDLRSIIRATTERRKRSTMSQNSPGSQLHRSLRRQMTQSLRFFYSINSQRSSAPNSFEESLEERVGGTPRHPRSCACSPNGSLRLAAPGANGGQLSPPPNTGHGEVRKKVSCVSNCSGRSEQGVFGMRNGRAHTYCSPRPVHFHPTPSTIPQLGKPLNAPSNHNAAAAAAKRLMAAFAPRKEAVLTPRSPNSYSTSSTATTTTLLLANSAPHKLSSATIEEADHGLDMVVVASPGHNNKTMPMQHFL